MNGPLGGHALLNDSTLMQKQLEFTGVISKIAIVKLFKRMRFSVQIKIEEAVPCGTNGKRYKPIETSLSCATQVVSEAKQSHTFPDTIHFDHRVRY